jgi:putative nucleotidyltransferase with HDIG domain
MSEDSLTSGSASTEIKAKLRLLNALNAFIIITLLAFVVAYLYKPVGEILDFLPDISKRVILLIVLILIAVGFYLSNVLSRQVVRKIDEYSHKLNRVLGITKEISEEIYGDILHEKIIDCSVDLTGSDAGSILLVDDENLVFKIVKGGGGEQLLDKKIPRDKGIAGWVAEHGTPQYVEDARNNELFEPSVDEISGYTTRSVLCVPLKTKSGTIGVIELLNKKNGSYDDSDIELVSYLAEQAAVSIERAGFYEDQRNYEIHVTDILIDSIDHASPDKRGHSKRVAQYAGVIARALNMTEKERRRLYFASLLHDIGYIKTGKDVVQEQKHSAAGYEMLNSINFYRDIAPYVRHHHERYDGSGYPDGLSGADIPLQSRIIAIAEEFDSMVIGGAGNPSDYNAAMKGLKENGGTLLDPGLVDLFIEGFGDTLE